MAENFDFVAGFDPTLAGSISGAQLLQMVNQIRPDSERGGIVFTVDAGSPPDVSGSNAKYKRYIWCNSLAATTGKVEVRTYNTVTPGWELIGYTDNSITTDMLQDLSVTVDKISSSGQAVGKYPTADGAGGVVWTFPPAELDDDARSMVYGQEYLGAFWKQIRVPRGTAPYGPQIVFSGDSTTVGSSAWGFIWNIFSNMLRAKLPTFEVSYNNNGSGQNINWWLNDANGLDLDITVGGTYKAGTVTAPSKAPDLLILRWGLNPYSGGDADIFETELNTALAKIRGNGPGDYNRPVTDLSIVLMSPNIADDTATGRDATYLLAINEKLRASARTYKCCFIDTTRIWPKAYQDDTNMMEAASGVHVHPYVAFTEAIASKIMEVVYPESLNLYGSSIITNAGYTVLSQLPAAAITTYSKGMSILRARSADSWPMDGATVTFRHNDGGGFQQHFGYADQRMLTRVAVGAGWSDWCEAGVLCDTHTNASILPATLPSTMPYGVTVYAVTAADGFPDATDSTLLVVKSRDVLHVQQTLVTNYGNTYIRHKSGAGDLWLEWQYTDPYRVESTIAVDTSGAGAGGTAAIVGDNVCGTITIETGTGPDPAVNSTVATINLVYAYPSTKIKVALTPASSSACTSGYVYPVVVDSSHFSIKSSVPSALAASQTGANAYAWNYRVTYTPFA